MEIAREDYFDSIKALFEEFERLGLWEAGFELIGSWCFKVFQNHCGVDPYPLRTLDVDFAVRVPYPGNPVNLSQRLKEMGFQEEINYADGSVCFKSGEFKVEFLRERLGDGTRRKPASEHIPELGITPQALPYLGILLENRMEVRLRDLGRVFVPSLPAFLLHKLLVAGSRKDADKRDKDYRQIEVVARAMLKEPPLIGEAAGIAGTLPKKWLRDMIKSAGRMTKAHPTSSGATGQVLAKAGILSAPQRTGRAPEGAGN